MKNILTILLTLTFGLASSQIYTSRTIEVHDGQMNDFIEMAGKKTKMFNNNGEGPAYATFEILSGSNSGQIFRVQIASPEQMDGELATQDELQYWEKNVVPLIKDNDSSRTIMWVRNAETSFVPEIAMDNDLRQVLFYNYKTSHEQDFWRFRQRQAKAWAAMENPSDSAMNVMVCQSGCNGNVVAIFFSYENYQGQNEVESEGLAKMVEKYNELFGEESYEQDSSKVNESLVQGGRTRIHMRLIREDSTD